MDKGIYYGSLQSGYMIALKKKCPWLITIKIQRLKEHHREKLPGIMEHMKSVRTIGLAALGSQNLQEAGGPRKVNDGSVIIEVSDVTAGGKKDP